MADFSRMISTVVFDIQGREQLAKFIADLKKADKELTSLNTQLAKLKAGFAAAFDKMDKKAFLQKISLHFFNISPFLCKNNLKHRTFAS